MTKAKEIAEAAEIAVRVVDRLVDYAKELNFLFAKAVSMPRTAWLELEDILKYIDNAVLAIDAATKSYFDAVNGPEKFIDNDDLLIELSSSALPKMVEENRAHCHEIGNIYHRYLSGVLSNLFRDTRDVARVEAIFGELGSADTDLFAELTRAADKMRELAKNAYRLKLTGQRQDAITLVQGAALELLDMRDKFNDADIALRKTASEFVKAARITRS